MLARIQMAGDTFTSQPTSYNPPPSQGASVYICLYRPTLLSPTYNLQRPQKTSQPDLRLSTCYGMTYMLQPRQSAELALGLTTGGYALV